MSSGRVAADVIFRRSMWQLVQDVSSWLDSLNCAEGTALLKKVRLSIINYFPICSAVYGSLAPGYWTPERTHGLPTSHCSAFPTLSCLTDSVLNVVIKRKIQTWKRESVNAFVGNMLLWGIDAKIIRT